MFQNDEVTVLKINEATLFIQFRSYLLLVMNYKR